MIQALYILLCAIPAIVIGAQLLHDLGANPVQDMLYSSGEWALHFLLLTLTVTPIRRFLPRRFHWIKLRRTLGLAAFFYALTHFTIFIVFELGLDFSDIVFEITERRYILVGFAALCILLPLAITSTTGWQRRLKRYWLRLHMGVYIATGLAIVHYFMLVKADYFYPIIYSLVFALLMAFRIKKSTFKKVLGSRK